jgi:hypothetical protein
MIAVGIYIQDSITLEYNRVDLFSDEKISVVSSIQNINDIAKTFTDFSQTFTIPSSVANNKIFRHWYDNSNNAPFSTLIRANAYIEIDTILFRVGKIQLEKCNLKDGKPQDYSITFIGLLGNLKDKFAGLYLKDLDSSAYDFPYTPAMVIQKVTTSVATTPPTPNIGFPLISSKNLWTYGDGGTYDFSASTKPIRYNELFPAIKLPAMMDMIETKFGVNFTGAFLTDNRFKNAYLYLKNAEGFEFSYQLKKLNFTAINYFATGSEAVPAITGYSVNLTNDEVTNITSPAVSSGGTNWLKKALFLNWNVNVSDKKYKMYAYKNGVLFWSKEYISVTGLNISERIEGVVRSSGFDNYPINPTGYLGTGDVFTFYVGSVDIIELDVAVYGNSGYYGGGTSFYPSIQTICYDFPTDTYSFPIIDYMPEIKIEDFFSGLLKMFNLTCFSTDGINYEIDTLENYYTSGNIVDLTKYLTIDSVGINRVKNYKKINFDYEKSESLINVGFNSANGIEYGSLYYSPTPVPDGSEYSIKLPFEDLNFTNFQDYLQVGYCLKTDYQTYIPKPIILYNTFSGVPVEPTPAGIYLSDALTGSGTNYTQYIVFGQDYFAGFTSLDDIYSLNFGAQQSTLLNTVVNNGLYKSYYENYLANSFSPKARLLNVKMVLPTSKLTTLKLNDRIIIKDTRYIINTMTTDLTTGEVQFELLTDLRTI